jgi:diaminopimelate epimerase
MPPGRGPRIVKAHAYGNDFLLIEARSPHVDEDAMARALCHRQTGIGADGLILFTTGPRSATMRLRNADGSPAELSGNGLRCLGALVVRDQALGPGDTVTVETGAGVKTLVVLGIEGPAIEFRTEMGQPTDVRQLTIAAGGDHVTATVLGMGNPQCVILGPLPDQATFERLGPALSTHAMFVAGTNVEFAEVLSPTHVRILIWERGVGPTTSSGTGTSAAAVAAMAHGGAARSVTVDAPGGSQRVEWSETGVVLTGWATVLFEGVWVGRLPGAHVP